MDSLKQSLRTDLLSVELSADVVTRAQMTRVELEPVQVAGCLSHASRRRASDRALGRVDISRATAATLS